MGKDKIRSAEPLRRRAHQPLQQEETEASAPGNEAELRRLLHESQLRQIELEREIESLRRLEWMLAKRSTVEPGAEQGPSYGDLTRLNTCRLILDLVGRDVLSDIVADYMNLLGTSSAVYEKNGDYAFGLFTSSWCEFLDRSSRRLCGTADNQAALHSGKWLCHESCWTACSRRSIETGEPVDVPCAGGLRILAVPIRAGDEIVGSINFGYGDPPRDAENLRELACAFGVSEAELRRHAEAYESRPPFLIELAKRRLLASARLIGEIVERKRAEEEVRSLAQFPEENPNPVLRIAEDGGLLYANAAARACLAAMGQAADQPLPAGVRTLVADAFRQGQAVEAELGDQRGRTYWFAALHPPGARYVNLYARDVTERKRAEQALRRSREDLDRAQEVGQIGSWRLDVGRDVLTWSDENHRIFGVPMGTPLTYESFLEIVHPDDRRYVDTQWKAGLRGEPYDIEHRIVVEGQVRWVRENAYLEFDDAGKLLGGFGITQDVTERKRAEEALRRTAEELARSNKELEQFAYVASHDLQEPLRVVTGYLQLIERRYKDRIDADANEFIHFAVDGAARMQQLISDLLEYSRVSTKGTPFAPTNVEAVLDKALVNLQAVIRDTGAVVTRDPLPIVEADEPQWVRLLQNLIGNGIKFRGERRPEIHVSARRDQGRWVFSVRDNGIGIEPQYWEKIFVIFQRLHARQKYSGTGIGLAICKRIVERHGGRIWLESQPGQGTTFYWTV